MNKQRKNVNNLLPFIPDGEFYFTKGVEAFQKQKFELSLRWLKKAIESDPKNPLYNCQLSIVYTEIGKYHAANQLLNNVLQTDDYNDCYYLLANNYAHLGLLNDSLKYAELYLDKEPDGDFSEEAYMLLEMVSFEMEEDDEDDWVFEEEDDLLKYQETLFYLIENEEWEKAMPLIEEMLVLFPDHLLVKHDYAQALFYTGNKQKAIALEQKTLEETDQTLHSTINLALFYFEMDEHEACQAKINELLNVYPLHTDQQIRLAVLFAKTGNYQAAYQRFRRINRSMARGHLSYFKWFSISAYKLEKIELAKNTWEEGCMKHRALNNHSAPWQES
ncbi:tetratricopeptide repeat protein [Oceanobacillus luteolus]|uniref:Tetratricopeptide repeat protein n=1 Tax=Oceanobacillus luteolus TaxID=1274358 RepID=A0ABW4HS47_9BACI